jgi:hypothetical protein
MPTDMPISETRRPILGFLNLCASALSRLIPRPDDGEQLCVDPAEDARLRSEFVQDMLCANPAAFQSEHDVQAMMHCFPGRF